MGTDERPNPSPLDGKAWWPALLLPMRGCAPRRWWRLPDGRVAGVSPVFDSKKCGAGRPIVGWQPAVSSPVRGKGWRFGPACPIRPDARDASDRIGDAGDWLAAYAAKKGWVLWQE